MLRISQIKLNPEEPVSLLPKKIGQKLRIRNFQPKNWKIVKESIDAREKPRIRLIYTVDFDVDDEDGLLARASFLQRRRIILTACRIFRHCPCLKRRGRLSRGSVPAACSRL